MKKISKKDKVKNLNKFISSLGNFKDGPKKEKIKKLKQDECVNHELLAKYTELLLG